MWPCVCPALLWALLRAEKFLDLVEAALGPGGPLAGAGLSRSPEVGGQQNNPAGVLWTQTPGHLLKWLCGRPGRGALATCAPGGSDDAVTPGSRPVRRQQAALGPAAGGSALHQGRLVLW